MPYPPCSRDIATPVLFFSIHPISQAHPTVPPVVKGELPRHSEAPLRRPFCFGASVRAHCGQIQAPRPLRPSVQPAAFARHKLPDCEPLSNQAVRALPPWAGQSHESAAASRSAPILKILRPKVAIPNLPRTAFPRLINDAKSRSPQTRYYHSKHLPSERAPKRPSNVPVPSSTARLT